MAPARGTKLPADTAEDDTDVKPTWDSNERNLRLFLLKLSRWLPRQHTQLNNFLRYGYIINSRQQVVVFDTVH